MRFTRGLMWLALLGLPGRAGAQAQPGEVFVHFGPLAWVKAQTALPRVLGGRLLVPVTEACDLLGLTCTAQGDGVNVAGHTVAAHRLPGDVLLVPLGALAALAGQTVSWNAATRSATVSGGSGSRGWRLALAQLPATSLPAAYTGPLTARWGVPESGVPTVALTVTAPQALQALTTFSKARGQLSTTGSSVRGSADVKNTFPGCRGAHACTLPVPRDALWVLAFLTAK